MGTLAKSFRYRSCGCCPLDTGTHLLRQWLLQMLCCTHVFCFPSDNTFYFSLIIPVGYWSEEVQSTSCVSVITRLCLSKETECTCWLRSRVTEPYDSTLPLPGYWAGKDTQLPLCERNKPTMRQDGHHSKNPREIWIQMSKNTRHSIFNLILRGANKARANLCSYKHGYSL